MSALDSVCERFGTPTDFHQFDNRFSTKDFTTKSIYDSLTRGQYKRVIQNVTNLSNKEILVGYTEKDCMGEPVTIPIFTYTRDNPQSTKILLSGAQAGCGKTTLGLTIAEMYNYHLKYNVVIFDAKPEAQTRKHPQDDAALKELLWRVNQEFDVVKPRGWTNMVSVKPMFTDRGEPFNGIQIRYDLNNLDFQDIITLFGLSGGNKADYEIIDKLDLLVHGRIDMDVLGDDNDTENAEILTCKEIGRIITQGEFKVDGMLRRRFKNLWENKVIGHSTDFNIVDLLNQGMTVQYQTRIVNAKNPIPESLAYMGNEVRNISRGRYAAKHPKENVHAKVLRNPVMLYFTEFQTVFPRDPFRPSSKLEITSVYNTKRAYGIDIVADSTSLVDIHATGIKQSDYIMTFRLDGTNGEYLRKAKNLSYPQMDMIFALEENKDDPPFQCAIIPPGLGPEDPLQTFYPLPPLGSLRSED